ncbi:MAG: 3-phosphoshikimate 1-carboxyvinyltransferase [Euryarchaeota archaeon]|nr:3-phosphoshikimate 1-carboxyvinyltransferase [Euryarchaeota archaeon]
MIAVVYGGCSAEGSAEAPPSKSYTHRAFVAAGLAQGRSVLRCWLRAGDTLATLEGMRSFGAEISEAEPAVVVGVGGKPRTPAGAIDCRNSGTTLRLLTGVAALDGEVMLTGDESLQRRPVEPLLEALRSLGVEAESLRRNGCPPVAVHGGGLRGGRVELPGNISSQFVSSLLMAAPCAEEEVEVVLSTELKSKPYVDMTLQLMRSFGAEVEREGYRRFLVKPGGYRGTEYRVEGDYSSAAFLLALPVVAGGEVTVRNLSQSSLQADRRILEILRAAGAEVRVQRGCVSVRGSGSPESFEAELGDSPDLLPVATAIACCASGTTLLYGVEHARYKESDRISTCALEFSKFGADIRERRDGLQVKGGRLRGAVVDSHGDHRLAMALSVAALAAQGKSCISGIECADISFPGFFMQMRALLPPGRLVLK